MENLLPARILLPQQERMLTFINAAILAKACGASPGILAWCLVLLDSMKLIIFSATYFAAPV